MIGDDDDNDFSMGGLGDTMKPPSFNAGDDDAFSIDLPTDDEPEAATAATAFDESDFGEDALGGAAAAAAGATGGDAASRPKRRAVMGLPIDVVVTVGRARPLLSELVSLRRDSILALDAKIDDPVELLVGDRVIARGELQEIDPATGRLGVRLTEVVDPQAGR